MESGNIEENRIKISTNEDSPSFATSDANFVWLNNKWEISRNSSKTSFVPKKTLNFYFEKFVRENWQEIRQ